VPEDEQSSLLKDPGRGVLPVLSWPDRIRIVALTTSPEAATRITTNQFVA